MSTSGGIGTGLVTPPAGRAIALGRSSGGSAGWTNQGMFLAAVQIPAPIPITQIGFQVTGAGDVGSTIVPVIYSDDGHGNPARLLLAGTAVAGDVVAVAKAACAFTLPAGWVWAGGLFLGAPVTRPTVYNVTSASGLGPNGEIGLCAAAQGVQTFPFQGGLAAAPDPFAGSPASVIAPLVLATT